MTINLYQFFGTPSWVQDIQTQLGLILSNLETMMSALDDELAAIKAKLDSTAASVTTVQGDVATVKADVEALLAKIAAFPIAGVSADQQAAIDGILASATSISTGVSGIDTSLQAVHAEANPPAPAPAPAPTP